MMAMIAEEEGNPKEVLLMWSSGDSQVSSQNPSQTSVHQNLNQQNRWLLVLSHSHPDLKIPSILLLLPLLHFHPHLLSQTRTGHREWKAEVALPFAGHWWGERGSWHACPRGNVIPRGRNNCRSKDIKNINIYYIYIEKYLIWFAKLIVNNDRPIQIDIKNSRRFFEEVVYRWTSHASVWCAVITWKTLRQETLGTWFLRDASFWRRMANVSIFRMYLPSVICWTRASGT